MTPGKDRYASVWVLTSQCQLIKVESTGNIQEKSEPEFYIGVSFGIDKTLWVVPQENKGDRYQIMYSDDEGQNWIDIELPNILVTKISATHLGSCFILTPQGSIYIVQKSGAISILFEEGTAHDMAVSPEGFIWIVSRLKKAGGGNFVYWCSLDNYVLQPAHGQSVAKKISASPEGAARIITTGGEVASLYLNRIGGLETPGGELFAKDIATSCRSNTIWIIKGEKSKKKKINVLKFWNPDLDPYMKWHTVPNVEPYLIAGGD